MDPAKFHPEFEVQEKLRRILWNRRAVFRGLGLIKGLQRKIQLVEGNHTGVLLGENTIYSRGGGRTRRDGEFTENGSDRACIIAVSRVQRLCQKEGRGVARNLRFTRGEYSDSHGNVFYERI